VIVLDTNVLSEPLRARPDRNVLAWLESVEDVAITSVSVGEVLTGVRLLPEGRRRRGLLAAIEATLTTFAERVLAYDEAAARIYAELQVQRRAAGAALSVEDGMIAAMCLSTSARLATRNVRDFDGLGLDLFNPWELQGDR
jgi:predicted nucleic acid-binding protein